MMMSFEEFSRCIEEHVLEGWMEGADISIQKTRKNNGITYHGLSIRETEESITPSIYLEDFFEKYQKGEDIREILEDIREEYRWAMKRADLYQIDVTDYSQMKERIIYRLVNYEKNKKLLEDAPFIRLHDLAITFRWVAHTDDIGISTALITNQELRLWSISVHELLLTAQNNTRKLFPPCILNMDAMLAQMGEPSIGFADGREMYVLTNTQQINGATALVYDGVLQEFAEKIQEDFYILPSSIHEMILVPVNGFHKPDKMLDMVKEANKSIVSPIDILSDSVYYYNKKTKKITAVKKRRSSE